MNLSSWSEPAPGSTRPAALLLAGLLLLSVAFACLTPTTTDTGDSVQHYLFAKFAFEHPLNFLDPWAKPLFTIVAAGPAQAGFLGVELLQCLVVAASVWCSYLIARRLRLPAPLLVILFAYAAPEYFRIQLSGLTEPLFGLVLVASVALALHQRLGWSAALIGFLPFVRSEGILMLGIWGAYLLLGGPRHWRRLPLLGLGFAVFALIGLLALGEADWMFTRNPYSFRSQYGHGHWANFIVSTPYWLGWVLTVLFALGLIQMAGRMLSPAQRRRPWFREELLLIYGSIVGFITAHSVFWALGLFGSFGLTRVLTVLTPLAAVVALQGLSWLTQLGRSAQAQQRIRLGITLAVVAFLFTNARTAHRWQRDFALAPDAALAKEGVAWFRQTYPASRPVVAVAAPYPAMELGLDLFDPTVHPPLKENGAPTLEKVPVGGFVFWDDWFARIEAGLTLSQLEQDPRFARRWAGQRLRKPNKPEEGYCQLVVFERVR